MVLRHGHDGVFTCVQCETQFTSQCYKAKYCSLECRRLYTQTVRRERRKPCVDCGDPIRVHRNIVRCDACKVKRNHEKYVNYAYKLEPGQYDRMFKEQGEVCAICGEPPHDWEGGRLSVDHDHETGYVRGLLHRTCNTAIGYLHTEDLLEAALRYMRKHNSAAPSQNRNTT
jgi:hypothetical protein